jgi:hypothetical protein
MIHLSFLQSLPAKKQPLIPLLANVFGSFHHVVKQYKFIIITFLF